MPSSPLAQRGIGCAERKEVALLVEFTITNFAIIETLRLELGPGFTVLTGETGTGKSIIIDAVTVLLGGRASAEQIRTGCESASVEGVFALDPAAQAAIAPTLEEFGLAEESGELILRREISRKGRALCRVNGHTVTLSTLQEVGRHLVDIHGQGEHLSLMQVRRHVDFLDRYGALGEQRQALAERVRALRQVRSELRALRQDARELARRMDLLAFQVQEIEAAKLEIGEEAELRRERQLLANAEKRMQRAAEVYALLAESEEDQRALTDILSQAVDAMNALTKMDDALSAEGQALEGMLYQAEELARTLRHYRDGVEYDPERLQAVEDRLELIQNLRRKYGDSIEEILAFAQQARADLDQISHSEERMDELTAQESELLGEIGALGQTLSAARREAAERLRQRIERELADLNMERAQFLVDIHWQESSDGAPVEGKRYDFDETGLDRVEFLISPNPGEELKPLVKIASGGETSRLMLAMKTALADIDPVPTLIFDEIDTGIGGGTGAVVGHKLWTLAANHQVFCVTHLPQIACYGAQHFRVVKEVVGERTSSAAEALEREQRIEELAVMLGGALTDATRRSAEELLAKASG